MCSVLKDFLRSVAEPMIPFAHYDAIIAAAARLAEDEHATDAFEALSEGIDNLPEVGIALSFECTSMCH